MPWEFTPFFFPVYGSAYRFPVSRRLFPISRFVPCLFCFVLFLQEAIFFVESGKLFLRLNVDPCHCRPKCSVLCIILPHIQLLSLSSFTFSPFLESKPYECSSCGKGFPQRWYLERHMVAVHKGRTVFSLSLSHLRSVH